MAVACYVHAGITTWKVPGRTSARTSESRHEGAIPPQLGKVSRPPSHFHSDFIVEKKRIPKCQLIPSFRYTPNTFKMVVVSAYMALSMKYVPPNITGQPGVSIM